MTNINTSKTDHHAKHVAHSKKAADATFSEEEFELSGADGDLDIEVDEYNMNHPHKSSGCGCGCDSHKLRY